MFNYISALLLLSVCDVQGFGPSEELGVDCDLACAFPPLAFCGVERPVNYVLESEID